MQKESLGAALVMDGQSLVGILSERDLVYKTFIENEYYLDTPIRELMTENPFILSEKDHLVKAMEVCAGRGVRNIPLQCGTEYKLLTNKDILQAIIEIFPDVAQQFGPLINRMTTTQLIQHEDDQYFDENSSSNGAIFFTPLSRVISEDVVKIDINTSMAEVLQVMRIRLCSAMVVTEYSTSIRGIITERDILKKVLGSSINIQDLKLSDLMTKNPHRVSSNHFLVHAINNMLHFGYRNILVVDADDYPIATVSFVEVVRFLVMKLLGISD